MYYFKTVGGRREGSGNWEWYVKSEKIVLKNKWNEKKNWYVELGFLLHACNPGAFLGYIEQDLVSQQTSVPTPPKTNKQTKTPV